MTTLEQLKYLVEQVSDIEPESITLITCRRGDSGWQYYTAYNKDQTFTWRVTDKESFYGNIRTDDRTGIIIRTTQAQNKDIGGWHKQTLEPTCGVYQYCWYKL